jgi:hypothetical protein
LIDIDKCFATGNESRENKNWRVSPENGHLIADGTDQAMSV